MHLAQHNLAAQPADNMLDETCIWRLCTIYEYTHMYFPYSSVPVPEEGCNDGGDWAVRVEVWG